MKNWMISGSMRKFAASASIVCLAALAAPAHAFSATQLADGRYEYFFEAPSLRIESAGDLDLSGLSFIEGATNGFRVGASFALDWLGDESAWSTLPASSWNGVATDARRIEIVAGGNLDIGTARLTLIGGSISMTAGTIWIGNGAMIDVGGGNAVVAGDPGRLTPLPGREISLTIPSPVPEPSTWALLLAGLLSLTGVIRRNAAR